MADKNEVAMTKEEERESLLRYEDDILGGLLAAASYQDCEEETARVEIARQGTVYFAFRIRPLSEEEYNQCRKKCTKYVRSKQNGLRVPENVDMVLYRSELIYLATVEEDRKKLWNNTQAWKQLGVVNGAYLIDRVLKAGEKDRVCDLIDQISGYSDSMEDTAKN